MNHKKVSGRKASRNRRRHHLSRNPQLQHHVGKFHCGMINEQGQALILSKLRTLRGTLNAEIHGNYLTCIFAPQRHQPLHKLTKRVNKIIRNVRVRQPSMNITPAFA